MLANLEASGVVARPTVGTDQTEVLLFRERGREGLPVDPAQASGRDR